MGGTVRRLKTPNPTLKGQNAIWVMIAGLDAGLPTSLCTEAQHSTERYLENRATSAASCMVDEFTSEARSSASCNKPFAMASLIFCRFSLIALKRGASSFVAVYMD
jgi:hypothetical protein